MSEKLRQHASLWLSLAVVLAIGLWPIITGDALDRETAFTVLSAVALASSLNILLGYTGYVSFGHVVFFGFGGYVGFYTINVLGWSLWLALLAGGLAAGLLAYLLGVGILRLRGAYFALATIGINEAVSAFINNFKPFGGPTGMTLNFSVYKAYGGAMHALELVFYTMIGLTLLVTALSYWVRTSKFGLGLLAIREDEDAAEVMGVVAPDAKTWAYVLSAIFPGMVGAVFFFKAGNIEPHDAFHLIKSIEMIFMVMLGGYGNVTGAVTGALVYERLKGFLLVNPLFKNLHMAISGVILLLIVLFMPQGIIGFIRDKSKKLRGILE
jgi:branched-chain amino acid transport system permease protein